MIKQKDFPDVPVVGPATAASAVGDDGEVLHGGRLRRRQEKGPRFGLARWTVAAAEGIRPAGSHDIL